MTSPISLSELRQWTPDHLDNLSDHHNELADNRENTMNEILRSANALDWTGAGKDGNAAVLAQHAATATSQAQIMRATAKVAKGGGQALYGQQQGILQTVQDAEDAQYEVSADWEEVKDVSGVPPDSPVGVARQGIAESIQADLAGQVGAFSSQEMETAAGITASQQGLDPQGGYYDKNGNWWPTYDQAWCANQGTPWDGCWSYGTAGFHTTPDVTTTPGLSPGGGNHLPGVIRPMPNRPGGSTGPGRGVQMVDNNTGAQAEPHTPRTIHTTPYPGGLLDRDRENPITTSPEKAAPGKAWRVNRTPYGDSFRPQKVLEPGDTSREAEDLAKASLGVAGIATGNPVLGLLGSTLGIESSLKDLFKMEPPGGVH